MVDQITDRLLTGAWVAHTNGSFVPRDPQDGTASIGIALATQEFLKLVAQEIDPTIRRNESRATNYEDLYSACLQVVQHEQIEIPNPIIERFVRHIEVASASLSSGVKPHVAGSSFASLTDKAVDLIQWAVFAGLSGATVPRDMDAISGVASAVDELDVFSLNHDLLIEAQLAGAGIAFSDGFSKKRADFRLFDWTWKKDSATTRLYKLHGSVDWYLFRFKSEWDQYASVAVDPERCTDDDGNPLDLLEVKPRFLTGTTVKEQAYGIDLFGEIFLEFRERLSKHNTLICCGYGWGDKGINVRLNQWLRDQKKNRLVILHNDASDDLSAKRF